MMVPIAMNQLNETNSLFRQTSGQQAIIGKGILGRWIGAICFQHVIRFRGDIRQARQFRLHAKRHFAGMDARCNFRIVAVGQVQTIQLIDGVNLIAALPGRKSRRIGQIKDRLPLAAKGHPLVVAGQKCVVPVARGDRLPAAAGQQNDKGRQIVIETAQPIGNPGNRRRAAPACSNRSAGWWRPGRG